MTSGRTEIGKDGLLRGLNPRPIPYGSQTVAALVEGFTGDAPALIDSSGSLTYAALGSAVRAATAALQALGLKQGDHIAASCFNHNALIIAFLAAQRLGLVWIGVNRSLATAEKCAQLVDCEARVLLADPQTAEHIAAERHRLPALEILLVTSVDPSSEWPALIARHAGTDALCPPIERLSPAAISYTSGTTGLPKGAVHTQHSIMSFINAGLSSGRGGVWEPGLRRSVTIALTILNGMTYGPLTALASGGSFVSMDRIDSAGVVDWIERVGIQVLCCTPPTVRDFLQKPELQGRDISSLRYVLAGGAAGATEIRGLFKSRIGSELIDEYGLTESPSGVAGSRFDQLAPEGAVGKPYPHLEVAALDGDGQPLPQGEVGEIGLRAHQHGPWAHVFTGMIGYWHQPDETAAVFRNGWLCTGDLGVVDGEGNLSIVGRLKDLIIRGGANVYPAEVERVLRTFDEVEEVVVLGMPDARLGEVVCSFIKLRPSSNENEALTAHLAAGCAAQLARYKIPESWYFVDEIPRNAMNKPDRLRLLQEPRREVARS